MKKLLPLLFLSFAFFSYQTNAADFIEAQMKFRRLADGTKDFTYQWHKEDQFLRVRLGLIWDNYEESLHGQGFNLRQIEASNAIFPSSFEGCLYYKGYGSVPGAAAIESNEIFLEFKGPDCLRMVENFNLGTVVVHFYNVKSWAANREKTSVFRLQMWDFPKR